MKKKSNFPFWVLPLIPLSFVVQAILSIGGFIVFMFILLNFPYIYSFETDPAKYLEFSLLESGTYQVEGFADKKVKNLVIPATYNGVAVTHIADGAFEEPAYYNRHRDAVQRLTIEEGVQVIGKRAFQDCEFRYVKLANSITTIDEYAFYRLDTTSIQLPSNVTTIGDYAFYESGLIGELDLEGVTYDSNSFHYSHISGVRVTENVPDYAFSHCIDIKSVTIEEGVTELGSCAFSGLENVKEYNLPSTLQKIGSWCFSRGKFAQIELPQGLLEIGKNAFQDCEQLNKICIYNNTALGESVFSGCTFIKVTFNNYQGEIDENAFKNCQVHEFEYIGECRDNLP